MDYEPKVSVAMSTYNRADMIGNAIESVLWQSYDNWELIISDDGSTDNTEEVVRDYMDKDGRIKYINKGHSDYYTINRNRAVNASTGDLICFRDDDGMWAPNFMQELIKPHRADDVAITYCGRWVYEDINFANIDPEKVKDLKRTPVELRRYRGETESLNNYVDVGDMMMKTKLVKGVGGFREDELDHPGYCSDMKLVDDILDKYSNSRMVLIPKRLHYYFFKHGGDQMTLRKLEARGEDGELGPEEEQWKF